LTRCDRLEEIKPLNDSLSLSRDDKLASLYYQCSSVSVNKRDQHGGHSYLQRLGIDARQLVVISRRVKVLMIDCTVHHGRMCFGFERRDFLQRHSFRAWTMDSIGDCPERRPYYRRLVEIRPREIRGNSRERIKRHVMSVVVHLQCCPFQSLAFQIGHFQFEFLLHRRIPVILNRVVRSSIEVPGDFGPFIAEVLMQNE
jgi:hypothetical protein